MLPFRILTLNARGIGDEQKRRAIFEKYRQKVDLLIIQETHSSKKCENIWESEWGGKCIFSHGTTAARGIVVLMEKSIYKTVSNVLCGDDGRYVIFDVLQHDTRLTIIAIYAPNTDSPQFFQKISKLLTERQEHKIIIGDFNLVLDVELDRENTFNNNNKAKYEVENIMDEYCLNDIWRIQNPEKREFSWRKKGAFPVKASRIDFALVSRGLDQQVKMSMYVSSIKTDHRAFYMVVELQEFERGAGYWKLNTSLLRDIKFVQTMKQEVSRSIESSVDKQPQERWEILKKRIKSAATEFSRKKVSQDNLIIGQLSEKVNEYEERLPLNKEEDELLEQTKADLEELTMKRIQGIMFRSKVRWYEEGEKSTKYFYALEKARYNAKTCYKIFGEGDQLLTNPQDILKVQKDYYQNLYSVDEDVRFTLDNNYGIFVPEKIRMQQDIQLTIVDLQEAMKLMNNNKTPGKDGIPVDFYKVFWSDLKELFYDVVLDTFSSGILHQTAREGVLNLIPKAQKDTRMIKNLRPITLLNTDYKIIEKAVANKMIPALEYIINRDQRGFMKDRRISVNIRKMLDIIHMAEREDLEAVILSLDFVKCFDKCSFSILFGSLDFFKFGEYVKKWTKILYKDFCVKIQNNGYFSDSINIKKGVHQGGCCSSIYFLVIAEILALSLRANQQVEGITFKDLKSLLNQFADDMDVFSLCKQQSLDAIHQELCNFRQQSGFTISYDKTTLYRIGSLRFSDAEIYSLGDINWSNEDINVLGVTIAHDEIIDKNYQQLLPKVRNTLNAWYNRGLSLLGKVQVVNTLVASLFVYKMMVLPFIPSHIVKKVDNMVREFLWNGKKAKVAYKILQNPKDQGGVGLVNLVNKDKALKATWPQILAKEQDYSKLVYMSMRISGIGEDIWRCNLHQDDVKLLKFSNSFWRNVLESWCSYNYYVDTYTENQIVWYNSRIKIGNKLLYWKDVHSKGLLYLHQLFQDGCFKPAEQVLQEFGLTTMRYNSLKSSIPFEWKDFFQDTGKELFLPLRPHSYHKVLREKHLSQKIYRFIAEDVMIVHNKYLKWRIELGESLCGSLCEYGYEHKVLYKVTNVAKYRSFQYRLLQRGIVTNIQLYKWKIIEQDKCSFCSETAESLVHLFCLCPIVRVIWTEFENYVLQQFRIPEINLHPKCIILNTVVGTKRNHVVNFLCLVTKQYIYRQRCLGLSLSFANLKAIFSHIHNVEKYVAIKNDKLSAHWAKWAIDSELNLEEYVGEYVNLL